MSVLPFGRTSDSLLFLSYKSDDAPLVRFTAEQLLAQGHSVWFNEYCVVLGAWDESFEIPLRGGVASATRAVFFTNSKWAMSDWCTTIEAKPLLGRLGRTMCLEIRLPPDSGPNLAVPELEHVPHLEFHNRDRWVILRDLARAVGIQMGPLPDRHPEHRPLKGQVNGINYELEIAGWSVNGAAGASMGNLILPRLSMVRDGVFLSANIIVGKVEWKRREVNDNDDRQVFSNLRSLAKRYFERTPITGKCIGVHLIWQTGLSHGAFTYWGGNGWCRKYDIILPARDGGADIAFTFTCSVYGDFACFCRNIWLFDDLVDSLRYGDNGEKSWAGFL